jgi:hypothetical protein
MFLIEFQRRALKVTSLETVTDNVIFSCFHLSGKSVCDIA